MKVVSNSGPLINLAKVGQFSLLQNLFQNITIPPEVFEEVVARGVGQLGAGETYTAQWIVRGMLERSDIANLLTAELDRGDAEVIALGDVPEPALIACLSMPDRRRSLWDDSYGR